MIWVRERLGHPEAGMTLVELLVAAAMSVVIVGAAGSMLISAVRTQPQISERNQAVSTVRYVQERLTREIRNGVRVDEATPSRVSFITKVRHDECGSTAVADGETPAIECQVIYDCSSGTACTRAEAAKGTEGAPRTIISGIQSASVFNFSPSSEEPTFIGIVLRIPNPSGSGSLTISDGASLRTPTLLTTG